MEYLKAAKTPEPSYGNGLLYDMNIKNTGVSWYSSTVYYELKESIMRVAPFSPASNIQKSNATAAPSRASMYELPGK